MTPTFPLGPHAGKPISDVPVGHLIHFLDREELAMRHPGFTALIRAELERRRADMTTRSPYARAPRAE